MSRCSCHNTNTKATWRKLICTKFARSVKKAPVRRIGVCRHKHVLEIPKHYLHAASFRADNYTFKRAGVDVSM